MSDRERKREDGNTKMLIPRERNELFRRNKKFFQGYQLVKKM